MFTWLQHFSLGSSLGFLLGLMTESIGFAIAIGCGIGLFYTLRKVRFDGDFGDPHAGHSLEQVVRLDEAKGKAQALGQAGAGTK